MPVFVTRIAHEIHIEDRHGADGSDMVTFAVTALPVLVVFAVANVLWAIWASIRLIRRRENEPILLMGAAISSWVVIIVLYASSRDGRTRLLYEDFLGPAGDGRLAVDKTTG